MKKLSIIDHLQGMKQSMNISDDDMMKRCIKKFLDTHSWIEKDCIEIETLENEVIIHLLDGF
jgi:hypothetical protein